MKYLPILNELSSSDSNVFFLIGLILSTVVGGIVNNKKKNKIYASVCLVIYIVCEIISNFRLSYLSELIALFIGTIALGGIIGFVINALNKANNKQVFFNNIISVLVVYFFIRTLFDFAKYNPTTTSFPFYATILRNALYMLVPALLSFIILLAMKRNR